MFGKSWKRLSVLLVFAVFATAAPWFGIRAKGRDSVTLGLIPVADNLPFHVAQRQGLFKRAGLDVKLVPFSSAIERDAALRAGAIDGCLTDVLAAALLEGTGADISIVSLGLGASPSEGRFALLASPGSGIRTARDLKGVPIGISKNSIIEYVADELLAHAGLKPGDIIKTDVPKIPIRLEMLLSGRLKAAVLPDPMAAYAIHKGAGLVLDDTKLNLSQTVLLFRKGCIRTKPSAVKKLLAAYGGAAEAINKDPEEYRDLLGDTANLPDEVRKTFAIDHYPPPQLPAESDVRRVVGWMKDKGLISVEIRYGELVDGSFLPMGKR